MYPVRFIILLILFGVAPQAIAQTTVSGRVTDLDSGAPLPDIRLSLCTPDGHPLTTPMEAWTDARGWYVLADIPPGRWCIRTTYDLEEAEYQLTSPALSLADKPLVLHFALPTALRERLQHAMAPMDPSPKSLTTITGLLPDGYVTNAYGTVVPGSQGKLIRYTTGTLQGRVMDDGLPLADALLCIPGTDHTARTRADGRFKLADLPPGTYPLSIVHGADTLHIPTLDIHAGSNLLDFSFRRAAH